MKNGGKRFVIPFGGHVMMFIRHSGSTIQYNTMQSNVKKERKKENEFRHAYKSTKLVCDSSVITRT